MNRAEITEIKNLFKKGASTISRMATCYVDVNKEIKHLSINPFFCVEEEMEQKYLDLLKGVLRGKLQNNLIEVPFSNENELNGEEYKRLTTLVESEFDEDKIREFCSKIIEAYNYGGNYMIILVKIVYDIMEITSDNIVSDEASNDVYTGILCSICPVKLSKNEMGFNEHKNKIEMFKGDLIIKKPFNGFLFPTFNDRKKDVHNVLFYTVKNSEDDINFIEGFFNETSPLNSKELKNSINEAIEESFKDKVGLNAVIDVFSGIIDKTNDDNDVIIDKKMITDIMYDADVDEECIKDYENNIKSNVELSVDTVFDKKKIEIINQGVSINVDKDYLHYISTKEIDGNKFILIRADNYVNINGIPVSTI